MSVFLRIAFNIGAFHALWLLALFGAGRSWWWIAPVLVAASAAAQLRTSPAPAREAMVILAGAAAGVTLDCIASWLGLLTYCAGKIEFVVVFSALWVNFGTTLRTSLSWMWGRPAIAAGLGALGGPMAYWVGSRIGAVGLGEPMWRSLMGVAVQYAVVLPAWMLLASRALTAPVGTGPQPSLSAAMRSGGRPAT